jgi:hypothetical protein
MKNVAVGAFALWICGAMVLTAPASGVELPADPQPQSIAFPYLADAYVGQFHEVSAAATSGLPVGISVEGSCAVRGVDGPPIVVAVSAGSCVVTASQGGNDAWQAATPVSQEFEFMPAQTEIQVSDSSGKRLDPTSALTVEAGQPITIKVEVNGTRGDYPSPLGAVTAVVDAVGMPAGVDAGVEAQLDSGGGAALVIPGTLTSAAGAGRYALRVGYDGRDGYLPSSTATVPVMITGDPRPGDDARPRTTIAVTTDPEVSVANRESVTFTALVTYVDTNGVIRPVSDGQVRFWWPDGRSWAEAAVNGAASHTAEFRTNDFSEASSFIAEYSGSPQFRPTATEKSLRVRRADDEIKVRFAPSADPELRKDVTYHIFAWGEKSSRAAQITSLDAPACTLSRGTQLDIYSIPGIDSCHIKFSLPQTADYRAGTMTNTYPIAAWPKPSLPPGFGSVDAPTTGPAGGIERGTGAGPGETIDSNITPTRTWTPGASELDVTVGLPVHLHLTSDPAAGRQLVRVRQGGKWVTLGYSTTDAGGGQFLPTFQPTIAGEYVFRLIPSHGTPHYITVAANKQS